MPNDTALIPIYTLTIIEQAVGGRPPQYTPAPCDVDLWPFDLESIARVTCDVGYLCANFGLLRPLFSRVIPDVRDRQTSDRLQMSDIRKTKAGRGHNNTSTGMICVTLKVGRSAANHQGIVREFPHIDWGVVVTVRIVLHKIIVIRSLIMIVCHYIILLEFPNGQCAGIKWLYLQQGIVKFSKVVWKKTVGVELAWDWVRNYGKFSMIPQVLDGAAECYITCSTL